MSVGAQTELLLLAASTLRLATPLIFAALAGIVSERAGVADLGLEGKMLAAAFAAGAVAAATGSAEAGLSAAMLAATLLSLVHFAATVARPGDQIVSGMAINFLAGGLVPTMASALFPLGGQTPPLGQHERLAGGTWPFAAEAADWGFAGRLYGLVIAGHSPLVYAALIAIPAVTALLYRTGWGLRLRACGENPEAVAAAGRDVLAIRLQALVVNGLLSGLAGAYLSLAANAGFSRGMSAGKGYLAIAALIFGRWKPVPALGACLLFAGMDAIQSRLQGVALPGIGAIPSPWIAALPYAATIAALAVTGRGHSMPKALGQAFVRAK